MSAEESNTVLGKRALRRREQARELVRRRLAEHDYGELGDIYRDLELQGLAPSRSTFYNWAKAFKDERARDVSGTWSLKSDTTGRPDIVMSLIGARAGRTGHTVELTVAEAEWTVRLALAVPEILEDETYTAADGLPEGGSATVWGILDAWFWALRFIAADTAGDTALMRQLETVVAAMFVRGGVHYDEGTRRAESRTTEED